MAVACTELAYEQETLWRNLQAPASSVPFIECVENLASLVMHAGRVDVPRLQGAIAGIVRHQSALPSRFPPRDGGAMRLAAPPPAAPVRVFDLRDVAAADREQHTAGLTRAELHEPFDVTAGPMFRAALITLDDDRHLLTFIAHHLVCDGPSAGILCRAMRACFEAPPNAAPPLAATYDDYVEWQRRQLAGAKLARLRTFWLRKLDGLPDRRLTAAGSRSIASTRSKHVRFGVSAADTDALRRLSVKCRVSLATMLLAVFAVVLRERTDSSDVVIGLPLSTRPTDQYDQTVGLFVNPVAVRTEVSGTFAFVDLLRRLWSDVLEAYQHRGFPYECLIGELGARAGTGPPPFRVVFNFANALPRDATLAGFLGSDLPAAREPPSLADLSLHVLDDGTALDGCGLYKADLFSESQVVDVMDRVQRLAHDIARNPDQRINHLARS
jgi:pipecolate-incorporating enzyme